MMFADRKLLGELLLFAEGQFSSMGAARTASYIFFTSHRESCLQGS